MLLLHSVNVTVLIVIGLPSLRDTWMTPQKQYKDVYVMLCCVFCQLLPKPMTVVKKGIKKNQSRKYTQKGNFQNKTGISPKPFHNNKCQTFKTSTIPKPSQKHYIKNHILLHKILNILGAYVRKVHSHRSIQRSSALYAYSHNFEISAPRNKSTAFKCFSVRTRLGSL